MKVICLAIVLALGTAVPSVTLAWDLYYDGSVLPNDPQLGVDVWHTYEPSDLSQCSSDGSVLHVVDASADATAYFTKYAAPGFAPVTAEARVRVVSGDGVTFDVGTATFWTKLRLYPERIDVEFVPGSVLAYYVDLSAFRDIRVATTAQGLSYVWVEGSMIAQGATSVGNQGVILFGGASRYGRSDSYWDYVAYSNAFLPVPEPSSLAGLAMALTALGGLTLKRKGRNTYA